jgi:hypothetical protein
LCGKAVHTLWEQKRKRRRRRRGKDEEEEQCSGFIDCFSFYKMLFLLELKFLKDRNLL